MIKVFLLIIIIIIIITPQKVYFITYFFPLSTKCSVEPPLSTQFTSAVIVAKTYQHRAKEIVCLQLYFGQTCCIHFIVTELRPRK